MTGRVMLDTFTALDDVPRKLRNNAPTVLRALAKVGRFSCFEVDGKLGAAITSLIRDGMITTDHETIGYPWTLVTITDAGRAAMELRRGAPAATAERDGWWMATSHHAARAARARARCADSTLARSTTPNGSTGRARGGR